MSKKKVDNLDSSLNHLVEKWGLSMTESQKSNFLNRFKKMFLIASDLPISALPAATTPLTGTELFPLVQGGVTDKATINDILAIVPTITIPYVTVGSTGGAQYTTIQAAMAAGHRNIWVISHTTETVNDTFSGFLNIIISNGQGITLNNATPFVAIGGASLNISCLGIGYIFSNFTENANCIDFTGANNTYESSINGHLFFTNLSSPTLAVKPWAANIGSNQVLNADSITHSMGDGGTLSYFDLDIAYINNFTLNPVGVYAIKSLQISNDGQIGYLLINSDLSSSATPFNLTSVTINRFKTLSTIGGSTVILTDGNVLGGGGAFSSAVFNLISTSSKCYASYLVNCILVLQGNDVDVDHCNLSGINLAGNGGSGVFNLSNNEYAGAVYIGNSTNQIRDVNGQFNQGLNIASGSNHTITNPNFGTPGSGSYTCTISAGVTNTVISNACANVDIVDNGTGTQIIAATRLF